MREGSKEEQEGFTKTVIPTETGHIPLLFSFHLYNVARQTEDSEGQPYSTVRSSLKACASIWKQGLAFPVEKARGGGEEEVL